MNKIIIFIILLYVLAFTSGIFFNYFNLSEFLFPSVFVLGTLFTSIVYKCSKHEKNLIKYSIYLYLLIFPLSVYTSLYNGHEIDIYYFTRYSIKFLSVPITAYMVFYLSSHNSIFDTLLKIFFFINITFQLVSLKYTSFFADILLIDPENYRPSGIYSNPNVLCFFNSAFLLYELYKSKKNYFLIAAILLSTLLTFSRTGLLVSIFIVIYYYTKKGGVKKLIYSSILLSIVGMLFMYYFGNLSVFQRLFDFSSETIEKSRFLLWSYSLAQVIDSNAILGLGLGEMDNIVDFLGSEGLGPHNTFIYMYGVSGIMGLIFFIIYNFKLYSLIALRTNIPVYLISSIFLFQFFFNHDTMYLPITGFAIGLISSTNLKKMM